MPGIIAREGIFTNDTLVLLLKKTLLNPTITLPLYLLLTRLPYGQQILASASPDQLKWFGRFKIAVILGVVGRVNHILSKKSQNNWKKDKFDAPREIVVVTGGSGGIGEAMVKGLQGRAGKVVILDLVEPKFKLAPNVKFYKVDLSSKQSIEETCERVKKEVGNPTVLINNAGICRGKNVLDSTQKDIELTFAVNTISHYYLAQSLLPPMIAANHGHIITVASAGAYVAAPQMVDYNSSKAAAQTFHEGLAQELVLRYNAPKVRTTLVTQGYVKTPLFKGFQSNSPFLLPALETETVAEAVVEHVVRQEGGHVVLPRAYNVVSQVRGWPTWLQNRLRGKTGQLMTNWNGRQVM